MRAWVMLERLHMVERLWQMSLLACAVIGFVLLLRLFLKRCSRGYSYGLWLLALLRLLCPVLIESDYSVQPLALTGESAESSGQQDLGRYLKGQYARGQQARGNRDFPGYAGVSSGIGSGYGMNWQDQTKGGNAETDMYGESSVQNLPVANPVSSLGGQGWRRWIPWLRGVYVFGVAALSLHYVVLYFCWKWRLSAAVRQKGNIWYSERVSSPFVLGIMRPRIYLPYGLDAQEESHILLHEQTHIRHGDPLLRLLGTFALCLHWWNPLVWLGTHCFYQDMEMFCDEAAMGGAPLSDRRAYAQTLLHFALRQSRPGMALAFGEPHTEQRVRNILRPKRRGRRITLTVALAAAVGGMIFLTVPQGSRVEARAAGDLTGQGGTLAGQFNGQSGAVTGEMRGGSDVPEAGAEYDTWSTDSGQYGKSAVFTEVYPEGQDQEALDYLEGSWRISGTDMWDQKWPRPDGRIGEVLRYENGSFRHLNPAGDVVYEHALAGSSSSSHSKEELWNNCSILFPGSNEEPVKRILVNIGYLEDGCALGNVIYVVSENVMLVCDLNDAGTLWTAAREELRGEDREICEYLQGTWEITDIAGRPYDILEQEEADAFIGTKLIYDWQNAAREYTLEGAWNCSMPIQGFGQKMDNSANWLPEADIPKGELLWYRVNLGDGEAFGDNLIKMDENRVWIYYRGTFFEAKRVE